MNGNPQNPTFTDKLISAVLIGMGRLWPSRRGKGYIFSKYVVDRRWQSGLAQIMPVIRTKAGFRLHGPAVDYTADWIRFFGSHEVSTERFVRRYARRGSTMLDIGSNIGYFAFLAATVNGTRSIAFEPNPEIVKFLRKSIQENRTGDLVEVMEFALGDTDGRGRIIPDSTKPDTGTAHIEADPSGTVKVERFDSLEARLGPFRDVSVVKIDVEGWELAVLRGMHDFLRRERPALAVEDLPGNYGISGRYQGDLDEILKPLGYVEEDNWRGFDRVPTNRFYVHPEQGNLSVPK